MIGALPEAVIVGGAEYAIRSDYRNVLQVFEAFNDPDLEQGEKTLVMIYLMLESFSCADDVLEAAAGGFNIEEAVDQIMWFIRAGAAEKKDKDMDKPTYDWEQDEQIIFSAVNKITRDEVREVRYMHWWTFLGYFHEVGEGFFSYVVSIRNKLNRGKKLDKSESEFYRRNKELVNIKKRLNREEQEEEDQFQSLLDEVL